MSKGKFQELINQPKPVLVDFFAEWCGPCQAMKPILKEVKAKMGDDVSILKIDVDKNPELSMKYNVRSVPTLMIFKDGELKFRQPGVLQAGQLTQLLQEQQN